MTSEPHRALPLIPRTPAAVRQEIAEAAIRLFLDQGFVETTVDEIVAEAGVSRRTYFRYFATKDDAVLAFLTGLSDRLVERFLARPADEPAFVAVQTAIREEFAELDSDGPRARELGRLIRETPSLRARHLAIHHEWELEIAAAIARRRGLPDDDLRSRLIAAFAVIALDIGSAHWTVDENTVLIEEIDRVFQAIRDPRLWGSHLRDDTEEAPAPWVSPHEDDQA